jgi:hypothetical protein
MSKDDDFAGPGSVERRRGTPDAQTERFPLVRALALFGVVGCTVALVLTDSPVWFAAALVGAIVAGIPTRAEHREAAEKAAKKAELRAQSPPEYARIFDQDPPDDINAHEGDMVDTYDAETRTYVGRFPKSDIRMILDTLDDAIRNDFPIDRSTLEFVEDYTAVKFTRPFYDTLNAAVNEREYLTLRWMPVEKGKPSEGD